MSKILLAVLLIGAIAATSASSGTKSPPNKRLDNFVKTLIKYLPAPNPSKRDSTVTAKFGDRCNVWDPENPDQTIFDECDSYNTQLACVNSVCQCLDVIKVFEDNYDGFENEQKVWADAGIHIFKIIELTFNTSYDTTLNQCTGNQWSICPINPIPTDGLRAEVKTIIDGLNTMKCTSGFTCKQFSKTNDYVGFCSDLRTSSSFSSEVSSKPISLPAKSASKKTSLPSAITVGNWDKCEESEEVEACDSYNSYFGCYNSLCQCLGVEQMLLDASEDASNYDGTVDRYDAVRHLLKYANATITTSYDSVQRQCIGNIGSVCTVIPLPTANLGAPVVELLSHVSSFQCGCGLECVAYSERNPYAGTCRFTSGAYTATSIGLLIALASVFARLF